MHHVDNLSYKYLIANIIANYLGSALIAFYQLRVFKWALDPFLWRSG